MSLRTITRPLPQGKTDTILNVTENAAGTSSNIFTLDADSVLVSLWVASVDGDLDLDVAGPRAIYEYLNKEYR